MARQRTIGRRDARQGAAPPRWTAGGGTGYAAMLVSPPAEQPRRWSGRFSYRLSLIVAIPLLVALTGVIDAALSYFAGQDNIRALAGSTFSEAADLVADQTRAHLRTAPPAADLVAALFAGDDTPLAPDDAARRLLAVAQANPSFSWVSFSTPDGTYVGVHRARPGGPLVVSDRRIVDGKTHLVERTVVTASEWTPLRKDDDFGYDPRARSFYVAAVRAKHRIWIDPYVFFDSGVPGVSCVEPAYAKDGSLVGVVAIDFDLNILSEFVGGVHTGAHGQVFLYTKEGVMLAHPSLRVVTKSGQHGEGRLATRDDVPDPVLRAYFHAKGRGTIDVDGASYFAATREFEADSGLSWCVGVVAPEGDFMGGIPRTTQFSILVSLLALGVAIAISVTFATRMAAPLLHLSAQMERVGRFELDFPDPPPSVFREIALMNAALATMKASLHSFASYVPRDVVRAMLATGRKAVLGGETKELTVFFSDLAGFTSLAEELTPSELVLVLGVYFDEMTRIIGKHGGTVDKFIGDAIMAFWNAPGDDADHAEHAAAAAFACARRLGELKDSDPRLAALSARIGVATGDVIVGNIGSHERLNYTAIGDTVNLASRLEGLNKAYGTRVLVSESTYQRAKRSVVMRAVDVVAVKGKSRAVHVYEPIALVADGDSAAMDRATAAAEALDAYLARRFDEAASRYRRILEVMPLDVAAERLGRRAEEYAKEPPPEGWDGAVVMTEK